MRRGVDGAPAAHDALALLALTEQFEDSADARRWRTIAAGQGGIGVMLGLLENEDVHDPVRSWTWIHFAGLGERGLNA